MRTVEKNIEEKLGQEITEILRTGITKTRGAAIIKISHTDFFKDKLMI